jgi:hypothetical protein
MSLANSLRLLWIGGITDCVGPRSANTERFLSPQQVTVAGCSSQGQVTLYAANRKHSVAYFAHEADRFASASFESLLIGSDSGAHPRSTGWLLIRCYYAAFFALHSLMRLHGWACTRVSPANIHSLNRELALFFPGAPTLSAGLYLLNLHSDGNELSCSKLDSSIGGTHELLWHQLDKYFLSVTTRVLATNDPDGQNLVAAIDDFHRVVNRFGGATWFTKVRNRVNYAHDYGTWFPYKNSTSDYARLSAALSGWSGPPERALQATSQDELVLFAAACAFLVSACSTTIRDLAYRSNANSPFRLSSGRLVPKMQ